MPFALFSSSAGEIPPALSVPTLQSPRSLGAFGGLVGMYVSVLQAVLPLNRAENPTEYHQHLSLPAQLLRCLSGFSPEMSWGNFLGRKSVSQDVSGNLTPAKIGQIIAASASVCNEQL